MIKHSFIRGSALLLLPLVIACAGNAAEISLSPAARQALDQIYAGDPNGAIVAAHGIERDEPADPLGYAIEAEALWWESYCEACEIKWGMLDAWKRDAKPDDSAYLTLADQVTNLARSQLAKSESADMHVFAGIGFAFKARLYALIGESHKSARASMAGRAEFLHALQLDPNQADATAGLGIYNYFVDSLSPVIKILRILGGIPGGDKQEGIRQMKIGMAHAVLLGVVTRFYLARNLRTFDHNYADALNVAEPLIERYPANPVFLLLVGNLNLELGRGEKAAGYFHAAAGAPERSQACTGKVQTLANSFLASDSSLQTRTK